MLRYRTQNKGTQRLRVRKPTSMHCIDEFILFSLHGIKQAMDGIVARGFCPPPPPHKSQEEHPKCSPVTIRERMHMEKEPNKKGNGGQKVVYPRLQLVQQPCDFGLNVISRGYKSMRIDRIHPNHYLGRSKNSLWQSNTRSPHYPLISLQHTFHVIPMRRKPRNKLREDFIAIDRLKPVAQRRSHIKNFVREQAPDN